MVPGGRFEKLKYDHNPSIRACLSMEVVISEMEQPVVDPKGLKEILSLQTSRQSVYYIKMKEYVVICNYKISFGKYEL